MPFALYAYATSVLARGRGRREELMTRDEAARMIDSLLETYRGGGGGLTRFSEGGARVDGGAAGRFFEGGEVAGVMLGAAEVFFEYLPREGALRCAALVYRFRDEPRPGVLEGFFAEEREGTTGAGGGALEYRGEVRGLFLSRTYAEPVAGEEFAADVKRLAGASLAWGTEVLERVAARARRR